MKLNVDCVIVGGGIAGLFLLAKLRKAGYSALLLEQSGLGDGQTICSQGMIHGGMKYALQGFLSPSARAISKMPDTWRGFFNDQGDLHFSKACLLSDGQSLFSSGQISSKITHFFGAKALASHVKIMPREQYPQILQDKAYTGSVYQLQELVIDIPQLLAEFRAQLSDSLIKVSMADYTYELTDSNNLQSLTATLDSGDTVCIQANQFFFTAGEGNLKFLECVPNLKMQKRPLRMVMVKSPQLSELYGHAMMGGVNPEVTISSHLDQYQNRVWYIGGQLAETGVSRTGPEQVLATQLMLSKLFPWLDLISMQVASFMINRAEYADPNGARPESFSIAHHGNVTVAWPTKLALSPLLADTLVKQVSIQKQFEMPQHSLAAPEVAKAPWQDDMIAWHSVSPPSR